MIEFILSHTTHVECVWGMVVFFATTLIFWVCWTITIVIECRRVK